MQKNMPQYKNYYPLKLPKLRDVRNENFNLDSAMAVLKNGIARLPPDMVFKKDFLEFLNDHNVRPSVSVLLYTGPDHIGTPHIDGANLETGSWSMNWNVGSQMILYYYKSDDLIENYKKTFQNQTREYMLINDRELEKTETYLPQSPFLLRNDAPHSVVNLEKTKRWAYTLRGSPRTPWEDVIELFYKNDFIID